MPVDLARANALMPTNDLAQAGAVFNDATRLLDGGLWNSPPNNNNQQNYQTSYNQDVAAIQADLAAAQKNGIVIGGAAYTPTAEDTAVLNQVNALLTQNASAAQHAVGPMANGADAILHTNTLSALNAINGDPTLAAALHNAAYTANTGATDNPFQAVASPGMDTAAALHAATAQGATLADVGAVFNAAQNLAIGGLNNHNVGQFNTDFQAVHSGLQNIINSPTALAAIENGQAPADAALTTIHLNTLLNQTNYQADITSRAHLNNNSTVAARGTNDNILDMADIVQNDAALSAASGSGAGVSHTGGFALQPGYLSGTVTHYQDNQAQTNFWSQFLSQGNTVNNQLQAVANGGAIPANLATDLAHYQQFGASFAAGQGGVFSARFSNELGNNQGTLSADTSAALQGLHDIANGATGAALTHAQAQVSAAGVGFAADAMDVSGNNQPIGGLPHVYNPNATTVATATTPNGLAMGTIPVAGPANPNTGLATPGGPGHGQDMTHMAAAPAAPAAPAAGAGNSINMGQDPNHHANTAVQDMTHMANTAVDLSHMWHHA